MAIDLVRVSEWGVAAAAGLLTRGFADYFVKIVITEESLRTMTAADSVDLGESWVAVLDGAAAGAVLVARRGDTNRVAAMALLSEARRHGLGRALVEQVAARARERGDRRLVLEVIEQNAPAVQLYQRTGFRRLRRLVGFSGGPAADATEGSLQAVPLREAGDAMTRLHDRDWPWQISGATLGMLAAPQVAYAADGAWVVLSDPAQPVITVRGLGAAAGPDAAARVVRLLRAAMHRHPAPTWRASAVWPEEHAGWFTGAGLARTPLTQWQMERVL